MRQSAFTLIELLIVVAVIGILAAIAVPNFQNATERARYSRVLSDMRTVAYALTNYTLDQTNCPPDSSRPGVPIENYPWRQEGRVELMMLTTPVSYLTQLPGDIYHNSKWQYGAGRSDAFAYAADHGLWGEGPVASTMKRAGVRWGIFSCGSDRIMDMDEFRSNPGLLMEENVEAITAKPQWRSYQPTNGIGSKGDIQWLEGYGIIQ